MLTSALPPSQRHTRASWHVLRMFSSTLRPSVQRKTSSRWRSSQCGEEKSATARRSSSLSPRTTWRFPRTPYATSRRYLSVWSPARKWLSPSRWVQRGAKEDWIAFLMFCLKQTQRCTVYSRWNRLCESNPDKTAAFTFSSAVVFVG